MSTYCNTILFQNHFSQKEMKRNQIKIQIHINKLISILKGILTEFCEASVIGYDKHRNIYWCKMYDIDIISELKYCSLHIEIEIVTYQHNYSLVAFTPLVGKYSLINKFISDFTESIQLYRSSPFIRGILERINGL